MFNIIKMECQYCNKIFSSKSAVTHHQKTAKYCLQIQGKDSAEKEYKCECGKISNSKFNHEIHDKICTVKDKIIYLNKKIEELENKELENKELEKRIEELEEKNNNLENKNKELVKNSTELFNKNKELVKNSTELFNKNKELEGINKDLEKLLCKLEGSIDVYKQEHVTLLDIAKQPKNNNNNTNTTNTTTNTSNKVLNIKAPLDFEDKTKIENALANYTLEYFLDGQKGLARFLADNLLRDEENNFKYLCTDLGRGVFKYLDNLGNLQKDFEARRLTNYLVEGGIKEKASDISEEWIGKDIRIDKNKVEIALEKNNEVNIIDQNNQKFKKELASIVAV